MYINSIVLYTDLQLCGVESKLIGHSGCKSAFHSRISVFWTLTSSLARSGLASPAIHQVMVSWWQMECHETFRFLVPSSRHVLKVPLTFLLQSSLMASLAPNLRSVYFGLDYRTIDRSYFLK